MEAELPELEKQRLKLYGQYLKNDFSMRKKMTQEEKQQQLRRDTSALEKHIENTKKYQTLRKNQLKGINSALQGQNLNMTLSKKLQEIPKLQHSMLGEGKNFLNDIHETDLYRFHKQKYELQNQAHEHLHQNNIKKSIEEHSKEIIKMEENRHVNKMKEWEQESIKNYQGIISKHQQDMVIFEKHKRLMEQNQSYRQQVESFTNSDKDILDCIKRNETFQRRNHQIQNQQWLKMQMGEFDQRKSQEEAERKVKVNLESSMLGSVYSKSPPYEKKTYIGELKSQITEADQRKYQEKHRTKEKVEIDSIYGGNPGRERREMLNYIDKSLALNTQFERNRDRNSQSMLSHFQLIQKYNQSQKQANPEVPLKTQQPQQPLKAQQPEGLLKTQQKTSRSQSTDHNYVHNKQLSNSMVEVQNVQNNPTGNSIRYLNSSEMGKTNEESPNKKYFKSFNPVTIMNRYYGA